MAHYLLRNDGLFVGSSAAMNCVGAVKAARQLLRERQRRGAIGGVNERPIVIVTMLCDGGARHLSKFHCPSYLEGCGLSPQATGMSLDFID